MGVLTKDANVAFQLERYEAMTVAGVPDEFLPKSVEEVEQGFKIGFDWVQVDPKIGPGLTRPWS